MPQVRTYGPQRAQLTPLPKVSGPPAPPPEAYGAGFGRAAAAIGLGTFAQLMQEQRRQADQMAAQNAERQLLEFEVKSLYDPETGLMRLKGRNALGAPEKFLEDYDRVVGDIAAGLSNDRQRAAFSSLANTRRASAATRLSIHAGDEIARVDVEESKATIDLAMQNAIASATTPTSIDGLQAGLVAAQEQLASAMTNLDQFAERQGIGQKQLELMKSSLQSEFHARIIMGYIDKGFMSAAELYYEGAHDQIKDPKLLEAVQKELQKGKDKLRGQEETDRIMEASGGDIEKALAMVRDLEGDLEDDVRRRVHERFNERDTAKRIREESAFDEGYRLLTKVGRFDAVPGSLLSQMSPQGVESLHNVADRMARGVPIKNNWDTWGELFAMATTPGRQEEFLKTDLRQYRGRLDDRHYEQLIQMQGDLRLGKGDTPAVREPTVNSNLFKAVAQEFGIDTDSEAGIRLMDMALEEISKLEQGGRRLDYGQKGDLIRSILNSRVGVRDAGWFWFDKADVPVVEVSRNELGDVYLPLDQVSDRDVSEAIRYLKQEGPDVIGIKGQTDDQIQETFKQELENLFGIMKVKKMGPQQMREFLRDVLFKRNLRTKTPQMGGR